MNSAIFTPLLFAFSLTLTWDDINNRKISQIIYVKILISFYFMKKSVK